MRNFSTPHPARWKTKTMHPKSDFQLWQPAHFPTKNSINKPAMNQRRLLIAAVFHFKHPVGKDSKKHHKLTKYSVRFSYQSKQGSRCCINFLNELHLSNFDQSEHKNWTWSVTNTWPWLEKAFPACTGWIFASEVSLKSKS